MIYRTECDGDTAAKFYRRRHYALEDIARRAAALNGEGQAYLSTSGGDGEEIDYTAYAYVEDGLLYREIAPDGEKYTVRELPLERYTQRKK